MQRITKVGVVSFAKVMSLASVFISLIIAIPYGLLTIVLGVVGGAQNDQPGMGLAIGVAGGLAIMIFFPLFYGAFMFVFGLIYGLILNLVLSWAGGLELEIQ